MTLTTKNWTTVTMSSWGGRLALNMTCLLSPLPEPLPNTPAVFSCFNRSSFWFQITLSKTSAAPLLPASIISVSRSPRPRLRGSITTGAQNGKRSGRNSFKMIPNILFDHIFCTCRYQSLNLNHVREHSMPIYEFRWQRHTQVSHQGKAHLRYPVIKWWGGECEFRWCHGRSSAIFPCCVEIDLHSNTLLAKLKIAVRREESWKAVGLWWMKASGWYSRSDNCLGSSF